MRQIAVIALLCLVSACAGSARPATSVGARERAAPAFHGRAVAVPPEPPGGAAELTTAIEALSRQRAHPLRRDARLSELARRCPVELEAALASDEGRCTARARVALGLIDGVLWPRVLRREPDGPWEPAADAELLALLRTGRASHYGVTVSSDGRRGIVVFARRPAQLSPIPRRVEPGARLRVRGRLPAPYTRPVVEWAAPDGAYRAFPAGDGVDFDVRLKAAGEGSHQIAIRGHAGGEVVAVARMRVQAGERSGEAVPGAVDDGDLASIRAAFDTMRSEAGLPPLRHSPTLARRAAARGGSRAGDDDGCSVRAARPAALAAALQAQPRCRALAARADVDAMGVSVRREGHLLLARVRLGHESAGEQAGELAAARLHARINHNRRARGAPALRPDPRLGQAAREAAGAFLRGELRDERALAEAANGRLERLSLAYRRVTAVVAIVQDATQAAALEPVLDPGVSEVGIGLSRRPADGAIAVVITLGAARR
ncbi:MAG: hypothetical protein PVI30_12140 [Myxococcales bacterium]